MPAPPTREPQVRGPHRRCQPLALTLVSGPLYLVQPLRGGPLTVRDRTGVWWRQSERSEKIWTRSRADELSARRDVRAFEAGMTDSRMGRSLWAQSGRHGRTRGHTGARKRVTKTIAKWLQIGAFCSFWSR